MTQLLELSAEELERLNARLTHYTLRKMLRLTWRGAYIRKGGAVPGAYEPHDFVLDAIRKMLDDTRPWNRDKYETVEDALRASIDSAISQLVTKIDNIKVKRLAPQSSKDETSQIYEIPGSEPDPVQVVIDRDWHKQFSQAVRKELEMEQQLSDLFDCYLDDCTEPSEISVRLGITSTEVTNLKKRLRRKLEKFDPQFKPAQERVAS